MANLSLERLSVTGSSRDMYTSTTNAVTSSGSRNGCAYGQFFLSQDALFTNEQDLGRVADELNLGIQRLPRLESDRESQTGQNLDQLEWRTERRFTITGTQLDQFLSQRASRSNLTRSEDQHLGIQKLPTPSNNSNARNEHAQTTVPRGVQARSNGIIVPGFGTAFRIISVSQSGHQKPLPLALSPDPCMFYALFHEDDVDFQIQVDNSTCADRDVRVKLDIHNKKITYRFGNGQNYSLKTVDSGLDRRKLHFIKQSGVDGELMVGQYAVQHGISLEDASVSISRIGFHVSYSTPGYRIRVQRLEGGLFPLIIHGTDTVEYIKAKIQYQQRIPMDRQNLIFGGKQLENRRTATDCKIQPDSMLYLTLKVIGGGAPRDSSTSYLEILQHSRSLPDHVEADVGERGAIVRGERCERRPHQRRFETRPLFSADSSIQLEDFTIELRLAPKYKIF